MKLIKKKLLPLILALLLLVLTCIPGCATVVEERPPVTYEGSVTLRVLLANDTTTMFDTAFNDIIQTFKKTYPNVDVEVQRVKEYKENFETWEEMLAEVKSGNGPDIFILNTDDFPGYSYKRANLLFPDVNQAMREGQFANLSMFYDYDRELAEGLREEVMDAGIVDGFRYTLPLTYDYPVMFVDKDKLKEVGLDEDIFDEGIISIMDAITELGDQAVAQTASFYEQRYIFNFFPELVDYDTGQVKVEHDDITAFLESFLAYKELKRLDNGLDTRHPTNFNGISTLSLHRTPTWMTEGLCMRAGWSLGDVIAETALAKYNDMDMEVYPLTGPDGQIVAEVRQYAAINYSCENVALAYELIRGLLTEKGQWYESEFDYRGCWKGSEARNPVNMIAYPVRTKESVEPLFDFITGDVVLGSFVLGLGKSGEETLQRLWDTNLSDKDIPILKEELDVVRYPTAGLEWQFAMEVVSEFERGGWDPLAVDVDAAAEKLIFDLENHLWME